MPRDYFALILNVLTLAGALMAGTALVRRHISGRMAQAILDIVLVGLIILPACSLLVAFSGRYPAIRQLPFRVVGQTTAAILVATAVICGAYILIRKLHMRAAIVLLPLVFVTFGQAAWKVLTYNSEPFANKPLAEFLPVQSDSPRIVWLIFDRLDQRLSFVDRPRSIDLPQFDRLRSEAVYGSNAFPPSAYTIFTMPALVNGKIVGNSIQRDIDTLLLRYDGADRDARWGADASVFSEARAEGYNSGVVGWYLPYCRIFNQSLSSCAWFEMARQHNSYDPTGSGGLPAVMWNEFRSLFETNFLSPFGQSLATQKHARTYDTLLRTARKTIVDPRLNLVLVHLPIPHWPYFYNRTTGKYDLRNSLVYGYLDSLVLADLTLGIIRQDLEGAALWDRTTVLVSSDHSHRSAPRHLDGKTNPRVPFLLKLAGQKTGVDLHSEFNTVLTKELLLAILRREISTPQHVSNWIEQHRSLAQSPYDRDL